MPDVYLTSGNDTYTVNRLDGTGRIWGLEGNDIFIINWNIDVEGGPGDDTYVLGDDANASNSYSISFRNSPKAIFVDLQQGFALDGYGGRDSFVWRGSYGPFIWTPGRDGDRIEGSVRNDSVTLNGTANNYPTRVSFNGKEGLDSVQFHGFPFSAYSIQASVDGRKVTVNVGQFTANLESVEVLQFAQWDNATRSTKNVQFKVSEFIDFSKVGQATLVSPTSPLGWSNAKSQPITFSFMQSVPSYGGAELGNGFMPPTWEYKQAVNGILSKLWLHTGLGFVEVEDTSTSYGQLRFGSNFQNNGFGYAFGPEVANGEKAGDIWLDSRLVNGLTPGSEEYQTLLANIGKALGLQTPVPENDQSGITVLLDRWNDNVYTVMSPNQNTNGLWQTWFGELDLQALRGLYGQGHGPSNVGNTVHILKDSDGRSIFTLSDSTGYDHLIAKELTFGVSLDLSPGSLNSVGMNEFGMMAFDNLWIDSSTIIEEVTGTRHDDVLLGNVADNVFYPLLGNDIIDGRGGQDIVYLQGTRSEYKVEIAQGSGHLFVSDLGGANGSVDLSNIERLYFSDQRLAFDLNGKAGDAARVLLTVMGRESIALPSKVGQAIYLVESNKSFEDACTRMLALVQGTVSTSRDIVTLIWGNLTTTTIDEATLKTVSGWIDEKIVTPGQLTAFAAKLSLVDQLIDFVGLSQYGWAYEPYGG
jgi:hypothetical protein